MRTLPTPPLPSTTRLVHREARKQTVPPSTPSSSSSHLPIVLVLVALAPPSLPRIRASPRPADAPPSLAAAPPALSRRLPARPSHPSRPRPAPRSPPHLSRPPRRPQPPLRPIRIPLSLSVAPPLPLSLPPAPPPFPSSAAPLHQRHLSRPAVSRLRFASSSNNLIASSWDSGLRLYDVDSFARRSRRRRFLTAASRTSPWLSQAVLMDL